MNGSTLSDTELLRRFADASLPNDMFSHQQHVRTAWLFIRQHGMPRAVEEFSSSLKRFASAKGADSLFHVTVTWAFLLLIAERQQQCRAPDWASFAASNPDLLTWKPSILDRFYTPELLWSERARQSFVMPDRLSSRIEASADQSPVSSTPDAAAEIADASSPGATS